MIPFIDLASQQARLQNQLNAAIQKVLKDGHYINGPEVSELEKELASFCGRKYAIACANGTDALKIPLMAMNIGPGDAIFTSPFTFFATAEVIGNVGATPVFVDIDEQTYNLDPQKLDQEIQKVIAEKKLTPKGIIGVDIFGQIADYETINKIAEHYGLWVMEDAAQSFGALQNGRRACSFGLVSTTSFFPAKPLGCYGDGGMLFTDDEALASICRSIAVHGKGADKYDNIRLGLNSRLDTLQAAILLEKFKIFPEELDLRDNVAALYAQYLGTAVKVPHVEIKNRSAWAQYCVRSPRRKELMTALKDAGIPTAIYYPIPLHRATVFEDLSYPEGSLPIAEAVSGDIFGLPMHPYLTEDAIRKIANVVKENIKA